MTLAQFLFGNRKERAQEPKPRAHQTGEDTLDVTLLSRPFVRANGSGITPVNLEAEFRARLAILVKTNSAELGMNVTPMMAKVMLERNTKNRAITQSKVREYAEALREGRWLLSGEPIVFSKSGRLLSGQHRLMAVLVTGISFCTDVRFGIEDAAFKVIDTNKPRNLADSISISGNSDSKVLAAAVHYLYRYQQPQGINKNHGKLSHEDGLDLLRRNPMISASLPAARRLYKETGFLGKSLGAFLHYIMASKDRKLADEFFEYLTVGYGASGRLDPKAKLRNRFIKNSNDVSKLSEVDKAAITIKTWNALRRGETINVIRWESDREEFPRAI